MNITSQHKRIVALLLGLMAFAHTVRAQSNSHLGIGTSIDFDQPRDHEAQPSRGVGFLYRWHTFHSGWGPTVGFDWHSMHFNQPLGLDNAPLGLLRMRSVMAGFGHTQHLGRLSASVSLTGGYSFNHLALDPAAGDAYQRAGLSLL